MQTIIMLSLSAGLFSAPLDVRELLPNRVLEVIESRTSGTSEIEWKLSHRGGLDDGLVERFTTRTAGDTILQSNFGDANGHHPIAFRKHPRPGVSREELLKYAVPPDEDAGTRESLAYDEHVWRLQRVEFPLQGRVMSKSTATALVPLDFRAAGLAPYWSTGLNSDLLGLPHRFLVGFESAEWTDERTGRYETIAADFNGRRLEWTLDPRRGGAPIRATFHAGDRLVYASETDLVEVDGRWVPTSIRFYRGDNAEPYQVIDVQKATFDEPWHAQEITPADMGLLFGTQMSGDDVDVYVWSGTDLLTLDEYNELVYLYGVRPDRKILELWAALDGKTVEEYLEYVDGVSERLRDEYYKKHGEAPWLSVTSKEKDEWDLYVERFIKEHKLDAPRIKRANDILHRAKKLRDLYLRKHVTEIRRAERRRDEKKLAVFDAHTQKVFDKVLVRGLNGLVPKKPAPKKTASNE